MIPPLKALALDLDNTLYAGVLGEDGPNGVVLTEDHRILQQTVVELSEAGLLLTVVSRNVPEDVERLFRERDDFPLRAEHIASWQVSWGSKADGIRRAAADLRIAPDAFLMIDDNLGELVHTCDALPRVRLLFAGHSAQDTHAALRKYPGLWRASISETDFLRAKDLKANAFREGLAQSASDPIEYFRSLGTTLKLSIDPTEDRSRLNELSAKTNQFNLNLNRLSEIEIDRFLSAHDCRVAHIFLVDRLSDSGSIGAMFARWEANTLIVEELCISCRAIGRMLEDVIVTAGLQRIVDEMPALRVRFPYRYGPRNEPARAWLKAYAGADLTGVQGMVEIEWNEDRVERYVRSLPVGIEWKN